MNEHSNKVRRLDHLTICIHIPQMDQLNQTLANLSVVDDHFNIEHLDITVEIGGQTNPGEIQAQLTEVITRLKEIKVTEQETLDLLGKIDTTTNGIAANVQTTADVSQEISDDIDRLIAQGPSGGVSGAAATKLQALADRLQAVSDASDSQVVTLKAIAAKSEPIVPPPPSPVDIPPVP